MSSFSFTATGDREAVLEQLRDQREHESTGVTKAKVLEAVIEHIEAAREGATDFTVSGSVHIGYRQG